MRERSEREFEAFVVTRGRALLRTAHLLTGDIAMAEDLVQGTFERLARHWDRLDGDAESYARRTMANLAVDGWRRRSVRPREVLDDIPDRPDLRTPVDAVADRTDLVRALMRLPPRQRAVLVLRYFSDLTEPEVAAALGITVGTVKSTASRALAHLRTDTHDRSTR